ncbi:MAG: hypothetical protein WCH65_01210 [bacterium]
MSGAYPNQEQYTQPSPFALGSDAGHQYNEFPMPKKLSLLYDIADPVFSQEDVAYIKELHAKKVASLQSLSPSQQRKTREQFNSNREKINEERKKNNLDEVSQDISYESIVLPKNAQLIVDYYNTILDRTIDQFCYEKIHKSEMQKIQECSNLELDNKINTIPSDKRSEIVQSLLASSHEVSLQKEDIQKDIIAIFNTHAKKLH